MSRRFTTALLAAALAAASVTVVPSAASASVEEDDCPHVKEQVAPGDVKDKALWAQEQLNPERVWSTTKGDGATVAVIDSGVDASHPLLEGRVKSGKAYIHNTKQEKPSKGDDATKDCDGHGTEVAAIIAGEEDEKSDFYGLAPEAEIIPYRIANKRPGEETKQSDEDVEEEEDDSRIVTEQDFADAIKAAVDAKADVINLSVKYDEDNPPIREAVEEAVTAGVVVVAAAGNNGAERNPTPTYPANYPGVIGVGAVDRHTSRVPSSQAGPWVDIVAPGSPNLAAPLPGGKYDTAFGGTSGATAFVSGTAALLIGQHPDWNGEEISRQILGTAAPTPGGTGMPDDVNLEGKGGVSDEYGYGLVDPYMAVTKTMTSGSEAEEEATQMAAPTANPEVLQRNEDFAKMRTWALWIGLGGLGLFVVALAGVGAIRRGKKSGWQAKKADRRAQIEPFDDGDPIPMFQGIKGLKE